MAELKAEYNADTPLNVISTVLLVMALQLHAEGYKLEDIDRIVQNVGVTSNNILVGKFKVTPEGIMNVNTGDFIDILTKDQKQVIDNVVPLKPET